MTSSSRRAFRFRSGLGAAVLDCGIRNSECGLWIVESGLRSATGPPRRPTGLLSLIGLPSQFHRAPGKLYKWARPAETWCARAGLGSLTTEVISNRYPVLGRSWEVGSRMRKLLVHHAITKRSQT